MFEDEVPVGQVGYYTDLIANHAIDYLGQKKANKQRALRSGDWKYLIADNEFLFNLADDQRERANLAQKTPEIFSKLKQQWSEWDATMLPITADVRTYKVNGKVQADHYRALDE